MCNLSFYRNFLITRVRGNIDRIVRGRITIETQKRDRDNGERTRRRRAQGRRALPPPAPCLECIHQTIFSNQTRCRPGPAKETNKCPRMLLIPLKFIANEPACPGCYNDKMPFGQRNKNMT